MERTWIGRSSIDRHLRTSAWFLLLVLGLSVGMVWARAAQAHGLRVQESQPQVGWDPGEGMEATPLGNVTEDILGVGLSSVALGALIGLAGPWRAHMRNLRVERMYPQ